VARITNTPQKTTQPLIDPQVMQQHLELLGPKPATRIINAFVETTPPVMESLRQELDKGAYATVADQAHGLKSAVSNVGLVRAADLAKQLEIAATEQDREKSLLIYQTLETDFNQSLLLLQESWENILAEHVA